METPHTDRLLRAEASFGTTPASILGEMMRTGFCAIIEQLQITNETLADLVDDNKSLVDLISVEIDGKMVDYSNLADKIAVAIEHREMLR